MPTKVNLAGRRFGDLTVVSEGPPDDKGRARWLCRCDCGSEKLILRTNLRPGGAVSCGCRSRRELAGQRFGSLVVLERSDQYARRGSRRQRLWKCRCDCGEITYKPTDVLTGGGETMCRSCAGKYTAEKARSQAGYRDGTQLSRIRDTDRESDNRSGVRGVYLDGKTGKYRARIKFQGRIRNLGTFPTLEAAVRARKEAEEEIFGTFLGSLE